jgi:uncharacterized membrane protein SpoIIM required for sporulation
VLKAHKSISGMTPEELARIDVLYRRTTVHLAQVATRSGDKKLLAYLNDLTVRAHGLIYLAPRRSMFAGLRYFILEGFPRGIARNGRFHAAAAALLIAGALFGYFASVVDVQTAYALSSAADERRPGSTPEQLLGYLRDGRDESGGQKFAFASFLFEHNFRVAVLALATGFLAGVPTVILTFYNGMLLGVFIAVHPRAGIYAEVWAWLLPHGVTELGAIVLACGCGLLFGRTVLAPGLQTRADALRSAGREATGVLLGAFFMLIAAAIIESYLRQSRLSTAARLAFAAGSAAFWALYITYGALRERAARRIDATGVSASGYAPAPTPGSAAATR